jgi:hypothetical protein
MSVEWILKILQSLEFWISISTSSNSPWLSESRTELSSCGPNTDHEVEQLTVLCYSLLPRNVWQSPGNALIYTSVFVARKRVSVNRFLATDVSAVLLGLYTSGVMSYYITRARRNNTKHCAVELDPLMAAYVTFIYSPVFYYLAHIYTALVLGIVQYLYCRKHFGIGLYSCLHIIINIVRDPIYLFLLFFTRVVEVRIKFWNYEYYSKWICQYEGSS